MSAYFPAHVHDRVLLFTLWVLFLGLQTSLYAALTFALSFSGAASGTKCGQTSLPWDVSLLSVNCTPGVGKCSLQFSFQGFTWRFHLRRSFRVSGYGPICDYMHQQANEASLSAGVSEASILHGLNKAGDICAICGVRSGSLLWHMGELWFTLCSISALLCPPAYDQTSFLLHTEIWMHLNVIQCDAGLWSRRKMVHPSQTL